ncbi:DUF563 domain-containing protein [Microbacterium lacticum]|uniref:glycosyltransferase family 61 protein n=1 Tax=Microbacterium lacticum TaxID=33885 RepID=UPI001F57D56F|nr:glycosyltransferase 61 family protein [Microbacterium lacticum]
MTVGGWKIYEYPTLPPEHAVTQSVSGAIASKAESGSVHWDAPNPRRSFVRGAVYTANGRLVELSQRKGGMNSDMVLSVNPPVLSSRERAESTANMYRGRWLYAGSWMHGFGHFLVETLPTLWPLVEGRDDFDGICAHRFNSLRTFEWQFDLLGFLTDKPVHVVDDVPSSYEELIVVARPYHYQVAIHPIATAAWDAIAGRATAGAPDEDTTPVYLSRSRFQADQESRGVVSGREVRNSEDVDDVFASRGFRIAFPETLSVTEQIRLARSASVLAGAAGSALHLSVFAKPGARVIELGDARTRSRVVATQQAISSVKHQLTAQIAYTERGAGVIDLQLLDESLAALLPTNEDLAVG